MDERDQVGRAKIRKATMEEVFASFYAPIRFFDEVGEMLIRLMMMVMVILMLIRVIF